MILSSPKKIILLACVVLALSVFVFPHISSADASPFVFTESPFVPFGGFVSFMHLCNNGALIFVAPGIPPAVPAWFMITPATIHWSYYLFPHPGQQVLGKALPTIVPCFIGDAFIGAGFPIVDYGEVF